MEVYTASEIAEILEANVTIIRRKIQTGVIKGCKQRGEWRVSEKNFLEYTQGIKHPVTVEKFANLVKMCEKTIRTKILEHEIKAVRLGRWYVDYDEIKKFIGE